MRKSGSQDRVGEGIPGLARPSDGAAVVDFAALPRAALVSMAEAGRDAIECRRVLHKTGDNVVSEILGGQAAFYEWTHYPEGDIYDFETHAQFYYHAHPKSERPGEHGHFHTFMRPKGMPRGIKPARVPGLVPPADPDAALSHLIAIAMSEQGDAVQLFTTNRWVTGEVWYSAPNVIAMLDRFAIDLAHPSWPVNRWITAMVRLFRPQIEALLRARDRSVVEWQQRYPKRDVFDDRDLEVTSTIDISIENQMRRILDALKRNRR